MLNEKSIYKNDLFLFKNMHVQEGGDICLDFCLVHVDD